MKVAFLWHMHQPCYQDPVSGIYTLPWVRMHTLKDYVDMPRRLAEHPGAVATFNLVPSLIEQIEDYTSGTAREWALEVTLKDAAVLTREERIGILERFFDANVERMIKPWPRYRELYQRTRGRPAADSEPLLREEDWRDLQTWFNLTWCGIGLRRDPRVAALLDKGRRFTEEDKRRLWEAQREYMAQAIPLYRRLEAEERIEISYSPFCHPILPLLIDSGSAQRAMPIAPMPIGRFHHREDAQMQLERARSFIESRFGIRPRGLWPSEGSVSPEAVELIGRNETAWVATDDAVLARSLGVGLDDARRCRVYSHAGVPLVFRDRQLSDRLGFVYSGWNAEDAVGDLVARLEETDRSCRASGCEEPALLIALDGENAWEFYEEDGEPFFRALYGTLADHPRIRMTTVGALVRESSPVPLPHLHTGSWIEADFSTWIGEPTKNRAWDALIRLREVAGACLKERRLVPQDEEKLRTLLMRAEGSDWFWWFGEGHNSGNDEEFDRLFRAHLEAGYRLVNRPMPREVSRPIGREKAEPAMLRQTALIHPRITGRKDDYFEWLCAARLEARGAAMHRARPILRTLWFGFDADHFYLRVDVRTRADSWLEEGALCLGFVTPPLPLLCLARREGRLAVRLAGSDQPIGDIRAAAAQVMEAAIPRSWLAAQAGTEPSGEIEFFVACMENGNLVDRLPAAGALAAPAPGPDFELDHWGV